MDAKHWEMHMVLRNQKGRIALDIGACIGSYTLELARQFREVHAFEPNPANLNILVHNVKANKLSNIRVYPFALSNMEKWDRLKLQSKNGETGTFQDDHYGLKYDQTIPVQTRTLDSFQFQNVDLVKIDVEGWELSVLKGATRTLRDRPLLAVEVHSRSCNGLCEACEYLTEFGYTVTQVGRADEETPVHWIIAS